MEDEVITATITVPDTITATVTDGDIISVSVTTPPAITATISAGIAVETDPIFLASEAADFVTGDAAKLAGIEAGAEVNNISDTNATDLTDGGETALHSHSGGHDEVTFTADVDAVFSLTAQLIGLDTQAQNKVFASPVSGTAVPVFRALVAADIPVLAYLTDAGSEGFAYGRKDAAWVKVGGLALANVFTATNTFGAVRVGTPYNSNIQNTYTMPTAAWVAVVTGTVGTGVGGGLTVTGVGTTFLTDYKVGDAIGIDSLGGAPTPAYFGYITAIASDTSMTTDRFWTTTSGSSHRRLSPVFQIVSSANVPLLTVDSFGQIAYGGANINYVGTPTNTSANPLSFTSTSSSFKPALMFGGGRGYLIYDNSASTGFKNVCIFYGNSGSLMIREDSQFIYLQAQEGIVQLPVADKRQFTVGGFTTQTLTPVLFYDNTSATAVIRNVLQLETQSTGTAGTLGAGLLFNVETATNGTITPAGRVTAQRIVNTNGSETSVTSLSSYYNSVERVGVQVTATSTTQEVDTFGATYLNSRTNGVKIDTDGTLSLLGTATVWDDSMIPANSFRTGGTALTLAQFQGNIWMLRFDVGDIIYVQVQMPHKMKLNSVIYPHLHLAVNSAIGATNYNVEVTTETSWANIDTVFPTPAVTSTGLVKSFQNAAQYTHAILPMASMTPAAGQGGISSYVIFKIERITSSTQPLSPATSLFILGMDIHYEQDTLGSNSEYTK